MDELIYIKVIQFVDLQTALQLRLVSKFWLSLLPMENILIKYEERWKSIEIKNQWKSVYDRVLHELKLYH